MSRPLTWQLLRTGWAAGRGTPGDRVRFVALLLASALLAVTAMAILVATAVYAGRDHRDQARGPQFQAASGRPATALVALQYDTVDAYQHQVVFIEPLGGSAPPPPGLPRWPRPGEAFLSPELVRAGVSEHITDRYGHFAGLIRPAGLASPSERFAYVRPLSYSRHDGDWTTISGFGASGGTAVPKVGTSADVQPLSVFLLLFGVLTGLPAGVLVVVAVRCGSATRDRRSSLLQALGGSRRHRSLINLGEASLPVLLGTAVGSLLIAAPLTGDVRLPLTGFIVSAADVRAWLWAVPVTALASTAVMLALVTVLHRVDRTGRATRPRTFARRVPRWRLVLFVCMAAVIGAVPYVVNQIPYPLTAAMYFGGTAGLWATLPSVAAVASRRLGSRIARLGRQAGGPGLVIAGRWTSARPGVVVRIAITAVVGIGLITQLQVMASVQTDEAVAARVTQARIGDTVVLVDSPSLTGDRIDAFRRRLPAGFQVLALRSEEGRPATLRGPCTALRALRLGCPVTPSAMPSGSGTPQVQELARWSGTVEERGVRFQAGPYLRGERTATALAVIADHAGRAGVVKQVAYATLPTPTSDPLGYDWLVGGISQARNGRWLVLFGSVGLAILLLATVVSSLAEFLIFGTGLAPLAVHTDRRRIFLTVGLWHLTIPLLLATVIGAFVAVWQGFQYLAIFGVGQFSWNVLSGATAGAAALAVLTGLGGGLIAIRAARRWRPTTD